MKNILKKVIVLTLSLTLCLGAFSGCKGKTTISNEDTPLVLSAKELDEVFNPFFATSGNDTEVIGVTQAGMLATDKLGNIVCGDEELSVVKDYTIKTIDTRPDKNDEEDFDNWYTEYEFVLKNDLKFSDGSPLTIKDVLFNMYVYLDPVYTGSSTMYSINIQGLKAYRAQSTNENEQKELNNKFNIDAKERIGAIENWCNDRGELTTQVSADIATMKVLFQKELESDWGYAASGLDTYKEYPEITEAWQVFFIQEGWIELDEKKKEVKNWGGTKELVKAWKDAGKTDTQFKELCIKAVFDDLVENPAEDTLKKNIKQIITYWKTADELLKTVAAEIKTKYFKDIRDQNEGSLLIPSVSGITTQKSAEFNKKPLGATHDLLKVVVNGVDPKAIYNFSFGVAPMKYYSSPALYESSDIATNKFGVSFGDSAFMETYVRGREVPIGAGPYRAISDKKTDYYSNNVINYVRNDYFMLGAPKIKKLRYKVINTNKMYEAVANEEVHFSDPSAQIETVKKVEAQGKLNSALIENLGYGYIGINAKFVPDLEVRQAIMSTLDPTLCLNYYTNELAEIIYRPMSNQSWAYPKNCKAYYEYDKTGERAMELLDAAGWVKNSNGIYAKMVDGVSKELKLTFTIAGESESHPAAATLNNASTILNKIGCKITVNSDPNTLKKLANGELAVWAAAWSSTIDPDMYQVYHKDSTATSVNNWGYPYMLNKGTAEELDIINRLSLKIEDGRKTTDQGVRTTIYGEALDLVMDLAVEFPMYQRKNLYVWNKNIIDESTLVPEKDRTPYNGPFSELWNISFKI